MHTYVFYQCHKLIIEANIHAGGIEAAKGDRPPDYDPPLSNITPGWYKRGKCLQLIETNAVDSDFVYH